MRNNTSFKSYDPGRLTSLWFCACASSRDAAVWWSESDGAEVAWFDRTNCTNLNKKRACVHASVPAITQSTTIKIRETNQLPEKFSWIYYVSDTLRMQLVVVLIGTMSLLSSCAFKFLWRTGISHPSPVVEARYNCTCLPPTSLDNTRTVGNPSIQP